MTVELIRRYTWNNSDYAYFRFADGCTAAMNAPLGTYVTDDDWIAYALQWYDLTHTPEPDPVIQILMNCSDADLVAEVLRRKLVITVEGGVV